MSPLSSAARQMYGMKKAMHELKADNKKKGKARGANGKDRPRKQMVAIALKKAGMSKKK